MRSWMEEKKPLCLLEDPLRWTEGLKKPRLYLWGVHYCLASNHCGERHALAASTLLTFETKWMNTLGQLTTACHKMWAELIKLHRDRLGCLGCGLNGASNVTGSVHMEWRARLAAANVSAHVGSARKAHSSQELNFGERGPGRGLI